MRKKKSLYNIIFSLLSYFITMVFTFITQAIIVKLLGIEYSGVNGLFTNILTMLSVAELGIGTAIIFKLYEPLAKNNKQEINSWMYFYKKCYRYVALFVLIVGIIIIPLVPIIVGKTYVRENLYILYLISLFDVAFSYIMTYKRSLLYADQKNYIINIVHIGYVVLMNACQIIIIYCTKNYLYFLLVKLIYRVLENIIINIYVNKHYPYIKDKTIPISNKDKKDIIDRIKSIFVQKVSFVVNKGIDNITISLFLGVASVGYYTNYNLIATTLCGIIFQMISGFTASIGSLLTEKNKEKSYLTYKVINLINSSLTAICVVGFICCSTAFIRVWLGHKYILPLTIIISFGIYIYSDSIRRSITIYKEAAGICKEDKYVYITMAVINLIASIILCKLIGISGVIIGTAISYLYLIFYSYPKYIFAKVFDVSPKEYYIEKLKLIFIIIGVSICSYLICYFLPFKGILLFIIDGIISCIITTVILIILYKNTYEFEYIRGLLLKAFNKERKKHE